MKKLLVLCAFLASTAQAGSFASPIEVCFSPGGGCLAKLVSKLNAAQHTIDVAIYSFTAEEIAAVLKARKNAGVAIRVVADKSQNPINSYGSQLSTVVDAGIPVKYGNASLRIMHDKFALVDGVLLQTGSFNYTYSANTSNAENQLYITDPIVIAKYKAEFDKLWSEGARINP